MKKNWIPAHLMVFNNLGRAAQRKIDVYKIYNKDINPPWKQVREFQKSITPELEDLPGNVGIKCSYNV